MKKIESYYVSRSTGDKITIRTIKRPHLSGDSYIIFRGGWRVAEYKTAASVRRYIIENDCHQVESH